MATLFSEFLQGTLADVPGCPDISVEHEVRNSAIEFCKRSFAWRQQLSPISVTANVGTYSLVSPLMEARVIKIYSAILTTLSADPAIAAPGVQKLWPKTVQELDEACPGWRLAQSLSTSSRIAPTTFFTQESADTILLAGVPVVDGALQILGALVPLRTASGINAWVAEQYYEAICHGAKARLMAIPYKPWSNPNLAVWHAGEFDKAISSANIEASTAFQSNAPIRVKSHSK